MRPGPSSTVRRLPVWTTGSPGPTPLVSSYTWMLAISPRSSIISPKSFASPTRTSSYTVSYTHLRAHETRHDLVCRLLLEKKKKKQQKKEKKNKTKKKKNTNIQIKKET